MLAPQPPMALEGHCSVIHKNTLYVYTDKGFASLSLQRNGTWTQLNPGESVSGAACVLAGVDGHRDEEALYVVGGAGSSKHYTGLQRYSFRKEKWETLTPGPTGEPVTRNRTGHSVVYLKSPSLILMYAGSQGGTLTPTSDTYTIDTTPPYTALGYSTKRAKPAIFPILLPWNDHEAALVGTTTDKMVHLFHPARPATDPWSKSVAPLPQSLPDDVQCSILQRPDGSKVLQIFDMSTTPNNVTSISLSGPRTKLALSGQITDDDLNGYPTYNAQFASTKTWKGFALAQSDSNLVAVSGGDGTDSLAIFNQTSNSWLNTTQMFYGDKTTQEILGPTTTSPSTVTSSPPYSSASASDNASQIGTIIGAVLGGLAGIAVMLLIILLMLRQKNKARAEQQAAEDDKNRLSFQDRGEIPLARSAYPMAKSPVPFAESTSIDSFTILSSNVGDEKPSGYLRTSAAYGQKAAAPRHLPLIQSSGESFDAREAGQAGDRRTDEGWSKYFVDNTSATDLARQSDRSLTGSDFENAGPKDNAWPMKPLAPLNFSFLDEPRPLGGQVVSGSPTTEPSPSGLDGRGLVIPEGQSARISSADSISVHSEDHEAREEEHGSRAGQHSWLGRPPSSQYSSTRYGGGRETMTSNGRQSSVVIPEDLDERRRGPNNVNSDMSWLNLNAER